MADLKQVMKEIDGWFEEIEKLSTEYMKIRNKPTIRAFLEDIKNIPITSEDAYYYGDGEEVLRDLATLDGLRIEIGEGENRKSISIPYPMGEEEKEWSKKLQKLCEYMGNYIWYIGEGKLKKETVEYLKKKIEGGSDAFKTMMKEMVIPSAVASLHTLVHGGGDTLMETGTPVLMWGKREGRRIGLKRMIIFIENGGSCLDRDVNSVIYGITALAELVGGKEYSEEIVNRIFEVHDRMMKLKEEADKRKEEREQIEDAVLQTLKRRGIITSMNEERERHTILPYRISILTDRAKNLLRSGNFEVMRFHQLSPMFGYDEMLPQALYKISQTQNDENEIDLTVIKTNKATLMGLLKEVGIVRQYKDGYAPQIILPREVYSAIAETLRGLTKEKLMNMLKDGYREWEGNSTFRKEMTDDEIMQIYQEKEGVEITGVIWDKDRRIFKSQYERGREEGMEIENLWLWKTISSTAEGKKRLKSEIIATDTMHSLGLCDKDCTIEDGIMYVNERIKNSTVIGITGGELWKEMAIYRREGDRWILAGKEETTADRPPAVVFYENVERKVVEEIEERVRIRDYYIGDVSEEEFGRLAEHMLPQYRTRRLFEQLRKIKALNMGKEEEVELE